jgi:hypothetical protein
MGLLDDAIREHLELKRRHGADPSEVARQESEALGPARRAAEAEAPPAYDAEPDYEDEPEPFFEPEPEPVYEAEPEPVYEPEPEPVREPDPEPEPAARRVEEFLDQPTVEHPAAKPEPLLEPDPEPEPPEPTAEEDGDVLEGTPEFLEETPEHDRLWFEQRPPRDFDFDD